VVEISLLGSERARAGNRPGYSTLRWLSLLGVNRSVFQPEQRQTQTETHRIFTAIVNA
jgi:hypothetical protein